MYRIRKPVSEKKFQELIDKYVAMGGPCESFLWKRIQDFSDWREPSLGDIRRDFKNLYGKPL